VGRVGAEKFLAPQGKGVGDERETISVSSRGEGRGGEEFGAWGVGSISGDNGKVGVGIV